MASDINFVDFIVAQIKHAGEITAKKMFGEYGLYADEKLFGLICDNKLFMKPTNAGRTFIGVNLWLKLKEQNDLEIPSLKAGVIQLLSPRINLSQVFRFIDSSVLLHPAPTQLYIYIPCRVH